MCGIAGYIGTRPPSAPGVDRCLSVMARRGPDNRTALRLTPAPDVDLLLLNARLKILDLDDRANQPMAHDRFVLTYNGELYNHVELRRSLEAEGARFRTSSDTEVVLQAWARWGAAALDRFDGMWAFALYDETARLLTLCRDRFGEKPLYLYRDGDGLYFASEPKGIAALRSAPLPVDTQQIARFLVNGYKALYKRPGTFFEGLVELPPAMRLTLDARGHELSRERYWSLRFDPEPAMTMEDAVGGVRERLVHAVGVRLRADVPLAFCLSGGVDSNAIAGVARQAWGYDVHGFTIENEDPRYDERELVRESVRHLGIRHTAVRLETTDFLPRLADLVRYHDAPVFTIAYYVHWRLMEAVAGAGYRISVSGTGADELLTGYYDHHLMFLAEVSDDPPLHAAALDGWHRHVQPYVRNPHLQRTDLFVDDPGFREHLYFGADQFASWLQADWREAFCETAYTDSLLRNRMLNELFHENVPVLLHEDDLNAMYFSVENRSPYLDRDLAEFCYRIPTQLLVQRGLAKAVLREAARGLVADTVLDSPRKVGFNAPIFSLLDARNPVVARSLLADSPIFDLVRREPIADLLERDQLPNSLSKFLFSFVSAKLFVEAFA